MGVAHSNSSYRAKSRIMFAVRKGNLISTPDFPALATSTRFILEQSAEFRSLLRLVFIDFEKALDNVKRECMWCSLRGRGIPEKLVAIIRVTYDVAKCNVLHRGKIS